jgi:glutathione S-transferase
MTITITAFERSPDGGKGLARDTRVRWALEEVGQPYRVRLVSFRAMKEPAHLALHPFGQIPTYQEGDLALFETGSIVLRIAERHAGLLPDDADARARAITWMFAALSTVEPPILELANARLLEGDKPWSKERLPLVADRVRDRLKQLSARLGSADWLDGGFSAGDLMMVSVLLRLKSSGILHCDGQRSDRGPPAGQRGGSWIASQIRIVFVWPVVALVHRQSAVRPHSVCPWPRCVSRPTTRPIR